MRERTEWIFATLDDEFWIIVNLICIHITNFEFLVEVNQAAWPLIVNG